MTGELEPDAQASQGSLVVLALLAPVVGAGAGLVGAVFRLLLDRADGWRGDIVAYAQGMHGAGAAVGLVMVVGVCAAAAALAAWLVRRFSPHASGSGIPHVEAVLNGELPQAPFRLIGVKFVGGILAIGSGLALGREGPSVQMGASLAHLIGRICRRDWADCRVLLAAGAGAGLATAFNAPIAGAIFVLEELVRRFELRIAIVALGASASAISVSRILLGSAPDFHVETLAYEGAGARPLYFAVGAAIGLMAIVYNRVLLATIAACERLPRLPAEARAGLIGATVGAIAWYAPAMVGGGDPLTQRALSGSDSLAALPWLFLLRFGLGSASYAAGTPGGLFAPMLVLGAQLGLFCGLICQFLFPGLELQPVGFAIVGMVAFFTGVVRAPLTGIVLVTEMTSSVTMLLPMLSACFAAMLVPTLMGNPPIYDSLREITLRRDRRRKAPA